MSSKTRCIVITMATNILITHTQYPPGPVPELTLNISVAGGGGEAID